MINERDNELLKKKGITLDQISVQLGRFKKGFSPLMLAAPAIIENGIIKLDDREAENYILKFEEQRTGKKIVKFVPASGAATRMFKDYYAFLQKVNEGGNENLLFNSDRVIQHFINHLSDFAFYNDLNNAALSIHSSLDELKRSGNYSRIISLMLGKPGLNYGNQPKGLIAFHNYPDGCRTSFEEHIVEGALHARSGDEKVRLHFTVSPEFTDAFREHFRAVKRKYEERFNTEYMVGFSVQKASTDTIAVDLDNKPFRDEKGDLLFRPGGHGALIENLNELDYDIIFIKNIDNVAPDSIKEATIRYKKILAGVLLDYQEKIFRYIEMLNRDHVEGNILDEMCTFIGDNLCKQNPELAGRLSLIEKKRFLISRLARPVRVCGMVKNESEPGGGPFWAKNNDGFLSLQIVESSQVNHDDPGQEEIFLNSTHFNPVDLVCGIRDYKGRKFDLLQFIDHETGFISEKSVGGKPLKALELPGLWNGSMSGWNTLFVEVPIETFNPVKTIDDLLRKEHSQ